MLKRNLIAIAILILGLGITNAFGQAADWEIKPAVNKPKTTIKKPKQVQLGQNSGGTISNQRRKSSSQEKLGNFEIQDIKSPRDAASGQATGKTKNTTNRIQKPQPKGMNKADLTEQLSIKSPRDVATGQATGKRQHKPFRRYYLGDTATHEVGHKQIRSNQKRKHKP